MVIFLDKKSCILAKNVFFGYKKSFFLDRNK